MIKIWNIDTQKSEMTFVGHSAAVHCINILFNGMIVSGSSDTTIKIWDTMTGKCVRTIDTGDIVYDIGILPDKQIICALNYKLQIWDPQSPDPRSPDPRSPDPLTGICSACFDSADEINCIAVMSDGQVVCGLANGGIMILS